MVYGSGLENQRIERYREFESHRFRQVIGDIAQSVEQRTENSCVGGSIPPVATSQQVQILWSLSRRQRGCMDAVVHVYTVPILHD